MTRPLLSLDRLTFLEQESKVGYQRGEKGTDLETMDYLEFIARVTSRIPEKGQVKCVRIIASRLPEPAAFACADRFLVLRAAIDCASGPEYPR